MMSFCWSVLLTAADLGPGPREESSLVFSDVAVFEEVVLVFY
jgi:hypothetical protein